MAVYKGREVTLAAPVPKGAVEPIIVAIRQKDGSLDTVNLNELQLTKKEKEQLQKDAGAPFDDVEIIEEKDLQELRDSQDPVKIHERLKNKSISSPQLVQAKKL